MPLPPPRDHRVSLKDAVAFARRHREAAGKGKAGERGGMFHKEGVAQLLAQPGCAGLRFYFGNDDGGASAIVLVGVDEKGNDMTSGVVLERHFPCPPYCGDPSELNP